MRQVLIRSMALTAILAASAWAGALLLQVSNPEANPEAKSMNAVLVAGMTACHEPEKSVVAASFVQIKNGEMHRTALKVVPLKTAGMFAVIGSVPVGSVIDVAVANPEYKYQPRALVRRDERGVEWASLKRFFSSPPADSDVKAMLAAAVD